jgi:TolB-like protein
MLNKLCLSLTCCFILTACITDEAPSIRKQVRDSSPVRRDESAPKKRLIVLPFLDVNQKRPQSLRDESRKDFIRELNRRGDLIVVDSQDLKLDLTTQMKDGEYDLPEVAKAASGLGIAAILEGKVMDLKVSRKAEPVGLFRQVKTKFEASVRVRIALARTGKEILNTTKTVTLDEAQTRVAENVNADRMLQSNPEVLEKLVSDAFLDFAPQISAVLSKLSWEGRIAAINGDRIFLNVGKISGLQVGEILRVTEEGDEIFDPQTGNFIGKSPGRLKGTLEVISYFGQDGAISIIHSGAGFKENDRVEQY